MPLPGQPNAPDFPAPGSIIPGALGSAPSGFRIPSMVDLDSMEAYGLPDRYRGTIVCVRAVPFDYFRLFRQLKEKENKAQGRPVKEIKGRDGYSTAVAVYVYPDPGQGLETNVSAFNVPVGNGSMFQISALDPIYYNAVTMFEFVPSPDGINPAGYNNPAGAVTFENYRDLADGKFHITGEVPLDPATRMPKTNPDGSPLVVPYDHDDLLAFSGPFMAPTGGYDEQGNIKGSHKGVDKDSDWQHFLRACHDMGVKIDPAAWQAKGLAAFEGYRFRFDRGIKVANKGKDKGEHDLMLPTEYIGSPNGGNNPVSVAMGVAMGGIAPQTIATAPVAQPATAPAPMQAAPPALQMPIQAAPAPIATTGAVPAIDPAIVEFVRNNVAAAGGRLNAMMGLVPKVAAHFGVRQNEVYPIFIQGTPQEIANRFASMGFIYNPGTAEVSLT